MQEENITTVTNFILVGFPTLSVKHYGWVAVILCIVYVVTAVGNSLLVVIYMFEPSLHKPMYIIMLSLALSDIGFSTTTLPKIIARYWFNDTLIQFHVCFIQMLLVHSFGTVNSYIMFLMAMDRYIAICFPFRYPIVMKNQTMTILNCIAWALCFVTPGVVTIQAYMLSFCGPNHIYQCYCDYHSLIRLACSDHAVEKLISVTLAMVILVVPLAFIVYTYAHIIYSVFRIASSEGRWKTLSTCTTQMCIISIYYFPRCTVYMLNLAGLYVEANLNIVLILFYSLFPPLINPFIYCFRTKEIKLKLAQWFGVFKWSKSSIGANFT